MTLSVCSASKHRITLSYMRESHYVKNGPLKKINIHRAGCMLRNYKIVLLFLLVRLEEAKSKRFFMSSTACEIFANGYWSILRSR